MKEKRFFFYNISLVCVLIKKKPFIHETIEQQSKKEIYTFIMIVLSGRNAALAQPKKKTHNRREAEKKNALTQNKRTELNKRQKNDYTK